jgi:hypothetical protein
MARVKGSGNGAEMERKWSGDGVVRGVRLDELKCMRRYCKS